MERPARDPGIEVQSYRYLRLAMVGLLVLLATAVIIQMFDEQFKLRPSISAYYFTPAGPVFIGALVALGVCMIALQGTTDAEDILLNIGGMFAPIVALVPTARPADIRAALANCRSPEPVFTDQAAHNIDCSRLEELEAVIRLNVANNGLALVVTGLAALGVTACLLWVAKQWRQLRYLAAAAVIYLIGSACLFLWREVFVDWAHHVAAWGLFACIVLVAIVNGLRHQQENPGGGPWKRSVQVVEVLRQPLHNPYAIVAIVMLGTAAVIPAAAAIWGPWYVTLFWLEAALIALFATFWIIQTTERWKVSKETPKTLSAEPQLSTDGPTGQAVAPQRNATGDEAPDNLTAAD